VQRPEPTPDKLAERMAVRGLADDRSRDKIEMGNKSIKDNQKPFHMSPSQFGKKAGKHCLDWGLNPTSEEDRNKLHAIIQDIVEHADEVAEGNWRGQEGPVLFFIKGDDVVVANKKNEYVTILKGGTNNERVKNRRRR
jgi:hypothetical protein